MSQNLSSAAVVVGALRVKNRVECVENYFDVTEALRSVGGVNCSV